MVIRRRCDTCHVDLCNCPVVGCNTGPGGGNLALQQRNDLRNSGMVGLNQHLLCARVGDAPQHRDRLRDREREVVPSDRPVLALSVSSASIRATSTSRSSPVSPASSSATRLAIRSATDWYFGNARTQLVPRQRVASLTQQKRGAAYPQPTRRASVGHRRRREHLCRASSREGFPPPRSSASGASRASGFRPRPRPSAAGTHSHPRRSSHAHRNRHEAAVRTEPPSICQTFAGRAGRDAVVPKLAWRGPIRDGRMSTPPEAKRGVGQHDVAGHQLQITACANAGVCPK